MPNRKVIYTTGFKAESLVEKKGEDVANAWVDYRFEYFMRYTFNSLLNQNNADWEHWLIVDDHSYRILGEERIDRYLTDDRATLVFRKDQVAAGCESGDYDYYMVLRIDSDDMYRSDVTDEMMTVEVADDTGLYSYVQYTHGYIYKPRTKQLKEWWRSHMTPPFFACIYPHVEWWSMIDQGGLELFHGGHEQVREHKRKLLGPGKFCVGIQEMNMVTTIGKRLEVVDEEEKSALLSQFGVVYPEEDCIKSDVHDPWGLLPGGFKG